MFDANVKNMFFDRKPVIADIGPKRAKALSKMGAYVMTSGRQSVKKPPVGKIKAADKKRRLKGLKGEALRRRARELSIGASAPEGSPPYDQTGKFKNGILFGYDSSTASMVAGPAKRSDVLGESPDQGTVPGALERSGTVVIKAHTTRGGKRRPSRTIKVKAHPTMGPALQKNVAKFPDLFKA